MAKHGTFVENGRRSGTYPNVDAIKKWAKQRGMSLNGMTEDQRAFLIARHIKEQGIKAFKFMPKVDEKKQIVDEVKKELTIQIKKEIIDNFKKNMK
jgi:L-alanine-DL-glutamate epimerase-like enolase superfamily enzyme